MKQYPAVLKSNSPTHHQVVLAYTPSLALHIEGEFKGETSKRYDTSNATNITREYLQNTWGVVESKEHAEFIIELAELHGFEVGGYSERADTYFYFCDDYLGFVYSAELASSRSEKQITIPLPPKEPLKNAGDNLILGCDSRCDEWPQVGDEVKLSANGFTDGESIDEEEIAVMNESKIFVEHKGVYNGENIVMISVWNEGVIAGYQAFSADGLLKPKTPEEELRELLHLLWDENGGDFDDFVDIAIGHVTKKPQ